jgi:hypothetical protein
MNNDDSDDLDGLRPHPHGYDDKTAWGRINGRDRRKYARLWGIDLDIPPFDEPGGHYPGGEADFDLTVKLMSFDHGTAQGSYRDGTHRDIDEEEFAAAWRPPTESEMLDEIIVARIAEERRQRELETGPETRH